MLISEKRGDFLGDNMNIRKSVNNLIFSESIKFGDFVEVDKIAFEYFKEIG